MTLVCCCCALLAVQPALASGGGSEHSEESSGLVHGSPWLFVGYSFIAMGVLLLTGFLATRRISRIPGPLQNLMELLVGGLENFFVGVVGPGGERHVPFLVTLFLYILVMNLMGAIPFMKPPTSTLNMTIALALVTIVYVQIQGIRANGLKGYILHFWGEPWWLGFLMFPIHIIGELAKPVSLAIRLFGNIFGEETVVLQLALLGPIAIAGFKVIPIQFPMLLFGLFTSVVQALVFSVLAAGYIVVICSGHEEHAEHQAAHPPSAREAVPAQAH